MASATQVRPAGATAPVDMLPGIQRRTLVVGERMMLCEFSVARGGTVPQHQHPNEQLGYVISGRIEFTIDGVAHQLAPGDSYLIPAEVRHGAVALEDSVIVEAFDPPRDDYR